ncbi:hypothetical protein [Thermocatellispora tengchongensis]
MAATFLWVDGRYGAAGGTLLALSGVFWAHGFTGLFAVIGRRMPVYGSAGLLLALFGCLGAIAFGLQGFFEEVFRVSGPQSLAALAHYPVLSNLVLWLPGPLFPLTVFGLGVVLTWRRWAPVWIGPLLCLAAAVFPASRIPRIEWVATVADVLLLLPFAYLGWTLIRQRDLTARRARGEAHG